MVTAAFGIDRLASGDNIVVVAGDEALLANESVCGSLVRSLALCELNGSIK